ncbi:hypothetical protein RRG08_018185 [Elysia crispata]|uniref:Uncharacterized protein n=1 Tax=Elysia crispata TaxID=231223 RepID=A0AAE1A0K6_9GAST|nr:hypothetical protein RRG08_018185 [Elysia crispata]
MLQGISLLRPCMLQGVPFLKPGMLQVVFGTSFITRMAQASSVLFVKQVLFTNIKPQFWAHLVVVSAFEEMLYKTKRSTGLQRILRRITCVLDCRGRNKCKG